MELRARRSSIPMQVVALMASPTTALEILNLIRKSGMIEDARLDAYVQKLTQTSSLPDDARKMAAALVRDSFLTYFQAEQFLQGKWRGFTVGKYKLLERIGIGGMGQVFLCEHLYMKRRVAIKILPPSKAEQPAALGRFYREARASGSLDHPNIVRTHDIDQDGNFHFLVMEFVDGASLLEIVKRSGPMTPLRAAHYTRQATRALAHANRSGLVHRDIKPGNIMVDREGGVKILDMGLAKFFHDPNDQLTKKYDEHNVLGTADYVAPEQTLNSHDVDIRADIYALGATFYFMLAGHPPFPDGSVSDKLLWSQTRQPTPIRVLRPDVPEGLAVILDRMMAKDPRSRYQLPEEVEAALTPWVLTPIGPPTAEEMPTLSPAATEGPVLPSSASARVGGSGSGSMSWAAAQRPPSRAPEPASMMPGSQPGFRTPQSTGSSPGFGSAPGFGSSAGSAPGYPPRSPSSADIYAPASTHEVNPTGDTRNHTNAAEHTPPVTERPAPKPILPVSGFAMPDAGNPNSPPPSSTRMTVVVLVAALAGSALGIIAYTMFLK